ncbi:MAG: SLATT domain-containing protein [Candidatus Hodarchaeota archaeon]
MTEQITTKEKGVSLSLEGIVREAKRIEENCLYTSKSHFAASYVWEKCNLCIGIPTVILAAIAGTLAFTNLPKLSIASGILAIVVAILTGIATFLNPKEKANNHFTSGNNYDSLLSKVRIFWTIDCRRENSEEVLTDQLKYFSEQRDRLNRDCPQPPRWAYKKAKKGIEEGEANYFVDKDTK